MLRTQAEHATEECTKAKLSEDVNSSAGEPVYIRLLPSRFLERRLYNLFAVQCTRCYRYQESRMYCGEEKRIKNWDGASRASDANRIPSKLPEI